MKITQDIRVAVSIFPSGAAPLERQGKRLNTVNCPLLLRQFFPFRVNESKRRPIRPLVRVRAEEVALCLRQVLRQIGGAIGIEVGQAGRHCRDRDAQGLRRGDDQTPARLRVERPGFEVGIE